MKKIFLSAAFIFFATLSFAQKNDVSISSNNNGGNFVITSNKDRLEFKLKGDIVFTDDEKGIKSLSSGGNLLYKKEDNKLEIIPNSQGGLSYTINGKSKTSLGNQDHSLIAQCVEFMIQNGVNGKERAERIFKQSGFNGVLKEVDRFKSDYVKHIYLKNLGANASLSDDQMLSFLNKTDQLISSDYYKSELMNAIQENYLKKEATAHVYLQNVKSMKSDYYQANTIKRLLKLPLSDQRFGEVISIVKIMKSDYYQSDVLSMVLKNNQISAGRFGQVMNAVSGINSDYYKSEIISSLLKNRTLDPNRYSQTITAMSDMKSSFYKATILKNLVTKDIVDESEWIKLLKFTDSVGSDYEKANVLIKIADNMPAKNEKVKEAFMQTAKTIRSDYDYGRVMRSMKGI